MTKEESPKSTRRSTRSLGATETSNDVETKKSIKVETPTINNLVFGGTPLSYNDLIGRLPGRHNQIKELLRLLGPLNSPMFPLFVYGGSCVGKTSVVLETFRHLNRPFVYASCISCYSPQILFECLLNQLFLHRKNVGNGYSSVKRCVKTSDFVNFLREGLVSIVDSLKKNSAKLNSERLQGQVTGSMVYLIFDNVEVVREWDKSSSMLPFLFNLFDILKMPEVGLIFVSGTSPDTYYANMGYIEPIPIYFPEYTEDDVRQIFLRNQANRKLYSHFLDIVLKPFCRTTRRLDELSAAFSSLFKKYREPLNDLGNVPNEEMKRRLFSHLQPHISRSLNEIIWVQSESSLEVEGNKEKRKNGSMRLSNHSEEFDDIDFHMSKSAKYLLISAFLASRNPATLDASLFDSTGGSDNRKRKKKASEKSLEQKDAAEQELLMKGPGTFPLERLLAIFQCITSVEEDLLDEEECENELSLVEGQSGLMSDILLQLSSLCNANFIVKGGNCPLEGSTRYRSTISEDLALKVARSLKFPLPNYLYKR